MSTSKVTWEDCLPEATEFIDRCIGTSRRYVEAAGGTHSPPSELDRQLAIRGVAEQTARWRNLWPNPREGLPT